jgi:hypothetical protein
MKVPLDLGLSSGDRQALDAVPQLVPHDRSNRNLVYVTLEISDNAT